MRIELVKVGNCYVGRTFSDRWNLATLGATVLPYDRNQAGLKALRRYHADFTFHVVRSAMVNTLTTLEHNAMLRTVKPKRRLRAICLTAVRM